MVLENFFITVKKTHHLSANFQSYFQNCQGIAFGLSGETCSK